jgi:hypothetical protein
MKGMANQDSTSIARRARMNKLMIVSGCLLGLALACIPAYASPADKKIALSCNVASGNDVVSGYVKVTLCSSIDPSLVDECVGPTVCPEVFCNSNGADQLPISITMPCSAPSKVGGLAIDLEATVTDSLGNVINTGGAQPTSTIKGKGYSLSVAPVLNDAVSLTVK